MANKLQGKIALITGGGSGIGLATAKRFAKEGATVIITGRRKDVLDAAAKSIGESASAIAADVSKMADLDRLFATIKQQHGHLDIVFANAGAGAMVPIDQITEEHYQTVFDQNVKGLLFTVTKALPLLVDGSAIVLNSSIANVKGMPTLSVYGAAKAAVRSFARAWTNELKDRKIRVNVVSPGPVDVVAERDPEASQHNQAKYSPMIPLGRMGDPDEIAKAVVFLASDDASFVAGVELAVDGGTSQV